MNTVWSGIAATVSEAVPSVSPVAEAVMLAVPLLVGVNVTEATPLCGVTVAPGLKVPLTPAAEKVTGSVAVVTGFPNGSWIVA